MDRRMADENINLLQQKLDNHIEEFNKFRAREDDRWANLIACQERNTRSIESLSASTRGMVEVWEAANGTVKVLSALGSFVKWLSGFAIIGGMITWIVQHFK